MYDQHIPTRGPSPDKECVRAAEVPPGRSMGRGLPALGLGLGQEVTEAQLRSLFGEGRPPDADRLVGAQLAAGKKPASATTRRGRVCRCCTITSFQP
jgi:hypothetical protein